MRTAASRLPKDFVLEDRLAAAEAAVELDPYAQAGQWRTWRGGMKAADGSAAGRPYERVVLDLGCGKGEYTIAIAKLHPECLFVGLDVDGVCIVRCGDAAIAEGVTNVVFVYERDPELSLTFGEGELSSILMNFPTPFPKKKKAPLRLTYLDRLFEYQRLLAPGGSIRLRTDHVPLYKFSLTQLELAGYQLKWSTDAVRPMFPDEPWSGYEKKLVAQGAPVCGFEAVPPAGPAPEPGSIQQTVPLSLVSYLPENIEDMDYVPHGMQGCIKNMTGRRARCRAKGQPVWTPPQV